jgi:putative ABC transport system permease protein
MFSVYTTLSWRHLRRHWVRSVLIVASIALGIGALVATRCLDQTMSQAALHAANPLAGTADLIVSNGEAPIDRGLQSELAQVAGVKVVRPRIFEKVTLPDLDNRPALLVGLDLREMMEKGQESGPFEYSPNIPQKATALLFRGKTPVVVGKELGSSLTNDTIRVQAGTRPTSSPTLEAARSTGLLASSWGQGPLLTGSALLSAAVQQPFTLTRCGTVDARGAAAALGGNILVLDLGSAAKVVGRTPDRVSRLDILLDPASDRKQVRARLEQMLAGRGQVRTPEEQDQLAQSAMSGIQTGFAIGGLAALLVGMFLIYNVLSVTVAERRHEIGVLLGVGATRSQVWRLFAGEAGLLGLIGSVLGIPLGIGLATLGLQPVQRVLRDLIDTIQTDHVEVGPEVVLLALVAGEVTAVAAALVPAVGASRERPAEAVRRMPRPPSPRTVLVQIVLSSLLGCLGLSCLFWRADLPSRLGTFGGICLLLLSILLITPLIAGLLARLVQPLARNWGSVGVRLAADNLVRAPGRTGLVIAALAAGVALVLQTAGTIRSNRDALRAWVRDYMAADLIVTSGSPVSASGQSKPMEGTLAQQLTALGGIEAALPLRFLKVDFRNNKVFLNAVDGQGLSRANRTRPIPAPARALFERLSEHPGTAIVSESFAALYDVDRGNTITLDSPHGPVSLLVIGKLPNYRWHRGIVFISLEDCLKYWEDAAVDEFHVYLVPGQSVPAMQETILRKLGPAHGLFVLTRAELTERIDGVIEGLHGIAYAQQTVVMLVAGLGVVMALLISVLQRRREIGLLRAIGATRVQVVRAVLAEAALMGAIGTAIGLAAGIALLWLVLNVVILEESGFLFPLHIPWWEGLVIAGAALLLATLAGLWPALITGRQRIPEAIAYE